MKTVNRLTHNEHTKLIMWLIAQAEKFIKERPDYETVSAKAAEIIGKPVAAKTICDMMKDVKKISPNAYWRPIKETTRGSSFSNIFTRLDDLDVLVLNQGEELRMAKAQLACQQRAISILAAAHKITLPAELGIVQPASATVANRVNTTIAPNHQPK